MVNGRLHLALARPIGRTILIDRIEAILQLLQARNMILSLLILKSLSANAVANVVPGTLIFDTTDKKVKYYKETDTSPIWFDLTVDNTGEVDTSLQKTITEQTEAKVSIGTPTAVPGILVLEDADKAMVLPLVDKYSSVINPSPGMMVYDVSNDMICLYNGTVWSFWKG